MWHCGQSRSHIFLTKENQIRILTALQNGYNIDLIGSSHRNMTKIIQFHLLCSNLLLRKSQYDNNPKFKTIVNTAFGFKIEYNVNIGNIGPCPAPPASTSCPALLPASSYQQQLWCPGPGRPGGHEGSDTGHALLRPLDGGVGKRWRGRVCILVLTKLLNF